MPGRILQFAGLAAGAVGLVLQFTITVPAAMNAGRSLGGAIVFYFSFFTILTNWAALFVHATGIFGKRREPRPFWARPGVRAATAVAMAVVFLVYAIVLAPLWKPEGLFLACDVLLHYVTPVLFVAWWLIAGTEGVTRLRDIPWWLIYPLSYLAYALVRAPIAGEVPYPFLDVAANGATGVAVASLVITGVFVGLSVLAVLADRWLGGFPNEEAPD